MWGKTSLEGKLSTLSTEFSTFSAENCCGFLNLHNKSSANFKIRYLRMFRQGSTVFSDLCRLNMHIIHIIHNGKVDKFRLFSFLLTYGMMGKEKKDRVNCVYEKLFETECHDGCQ